LTSKAQAHRYLLLNCDEIDIYIRYDNNSLSFYISSYTFLVLTNNIFIVVFVDESVNMRTKRKKWAKAKTQSQ